MGAKKPNLILLSWSPGNEEMEQINWYLGANNLGRFKLKESWKYLGVVLTRLCNVYAANAKGIIARIGQARPAHRKI